MKRTKVSLWVLMLIVALSAGGCRRDKSEISDLPGHFSLSSLYRSSPEKMRFDTVRKKTPKVLAHEMISEKWTLDVIRGSEMHVGLDSLK